MGAALNGSAMTGGLPGSVALSGSRSGAPIDPINPGASAGPVGLIESTGAARFVFGRLLRKSFFLFFFALCLAAPLAWAPGKAAAALFGEFTVSDEAKLGKEFNIMVRSRMPLVQDPEIIGYFENMVQRLSSGMPPQPFPFQVSVIRSNAVNAFAVPGGYIFINTGLVTAMSDEAEVAGVLAHEMAHVTQRHIAHRIESAQAVSLLSALGILAGAFLGGDAGSAAAMGSAAAGQAAMLNYSRTDESEADHVGMNYLLAAKYRPYGMLDAFKVLQKPQWSTNPDFPAYLSTHPSIGERINQLTGRLQQARKLPPNKSTPREHLDFLRIQTLIRGRYTDYELAMPFFNEQIKKAESPAAQCLANLGLGLTYERANQVKNATEAYSKAVACGAGDQVIIREAGRFHFLKGNKNDAGTLLAKAVRMNGHDYLAMFYYARFLEDAGNTAQAADYYRAVLRYVPEDPEVHLNYAQALGKMNKLFPAYLHLAYSSLYGNNVKKTNQFYERAKQQASSEQDKADLEVFGNALKERKAYW